MILTVFYDIILLSTWSTCISINLQRSVTTWKQFIAFLCTNTEIFFIIKNYSLFTHKHAFVIYISFSIHLQSNWIHHLNKHTAHDKMCDLYILEPFYTVMYYESLLSLFDFVIIQIHVFFKTISWNTVCYDVGVRTPNPTQRRTYSKTFITSVFSVVLSGAQTPSTEYKSEYEYEKKFYNLGARLFDSKGVLNR